MAYNTGAALTADALRTQQGQNFYLTTDSSFVFEFLPMNVSTTYNVTPTFQPYSEASGVGFIDVSASCSINVSAVNFSTLFRFQSNDTTFIDYPNQDISYGVSNVNPFANISFSEARLHAGLANPATAYLNNTSVDADYVRYMAKAITGGYALSDIFSNEAALLAGVQAMDASFCYSLNNNISTNWNNTSNTNGMLLYPNGSTNMYTTACKQLLDGLLANTSSARTDVFLSDLEAQSTSAADNQLYYIRFHPGDVLAVRLAYVPKNGPGQPAGSVNASLGDNPLYTRTYKVFLKMT
jgi:hypothetical protein